MPHEKVLYYLLWYLNSKLEANLIYLVLKDIDISNLKAFISISDKEFNHFACIKTSRHKNCY